MITVLNLLHNFIYPFNVFNNWIQVLVINFLNFLLDFLAVFVISNALLPDSYFSGYSLVI